MRPPESYYSEKITVSPFGIALLVVLGVLIVVFVLLRKKLPTKPRLYLGILITLLVGFTLGIVVDEYALAKNGILTKYHREENSSAFPIDNCANC